METRKVQFIGGATMSVSLPKGWVDSVGLKPGDRICFEPLAGGAIKLLPLGRAGTTAPRTTSFEASEWSADRLERHVIALYLAGFDRIEVRVSPLAGALAERLESISRRIVGLEAVERREDRVVFQDLLDTRELDARRIFERMYGIAGSIVRDALTCLARSDPSRVTAADARAQDLERLSWVAAKHQNLLVEEGALESSGLRRSDAILFATATVHVQRLGVTGVRLAEDVLGLLATPDDARVRSALTEVGSSALMVCDEAARALSRADPGSAEEALARLAPLDARLRELAEFVASCAPARACAPCLRASPILSSMQTIGAVGGDLAEVALLRAVPRANEEHGRPVHAVPSS